MSNKVISIIKHSIVAICLFLAVCTVLFYVYFRELDDSMNYLILGRTLFFIYLLALPVAAFLAPFIIKLLRKINFTQFFISAISSLAIYILLVIITNFSCYAYLSQFTPEKWEKYPGLRYIMFDDLQEDFELHGMTKDKLEGLLGKGNFAEDDNTVYYSYRDYFLDDSYIYFELEDEKVVGWHFW